MKKKASVSTAGAVAPMSPTVATPQASPEATKQFASRFSSAFEPQFFRAGPDDLAVSSLGAGTYLGECDAADDASYAQTIARALASGVNLIDTAINYRCQRSERVVGAALQRAIAAGGVAREAVVVCTKGGYVPLDDKPPSSREEYRAYLKRAFFDTGILTTDDLVAGGHSLAPDFLRHTIACSRRNLGLRTIDVYYLHNPEQQAAAYTPQSLRERLRAAFMVLEDAVTRGDIACYGCATWNALRVPPGTKGHLSVAELVEVAREVAGELHHFRAVQMPINLALPEAVRVPTQPIGKNGALVPALEAAAALGLTVVASAALMQAQLTHDLPDSLRQHFPAQRTDAQRALAFVRSLPGLTAALVGMRSEAHLEENLGGARLRAS
jgi:aryl-alcohol dehydrogenase-like predicted oxidoreductase